MTVMNKISSKHHIVNFRGMTVAKLTELEDVNLLLPKPCPMVNVEF